MIDRIKNEGGYSLVEVMVAIMILAIAIIPMVSMFDAGLRAAVLGGNYDRARALAHKEIEEIRALPYSSPDPEPASGTANSVLEIYPPGTRACTGTAPSPFTCEIQTAYARLDNSSNSIVVDTTARTMMQVTVTVSWSNGSYSTTGVISKETS